MPHTPSTGSTCCREFTACLVLAGCLPLLVFLDPAQLPYLQGTLATHLNNSVSSLNMQNMQHNPVSWVFLKRIRNCFVLAAGVWDSREGVAFASAQNQPCFRGDDAIPVALRSTLRLTGSSSIKQFVMIMLMHRVSSSGSITACLMK